MLTKHLDDFVGARIQKLGKLNQSQNENRNKNLNLNENKKK